MEHIKLERDLVTSDRILYTPSSFAKENLIYLQEIGSLESKSSHVSTHSDMDTFLFFIVVDGSGVLEFNHQIYDLQAGDCAFINCRYLYSHYAISSTWKLKWIHFSSSRMEDVFAKYIQRSGKAAFTSKDLPAFEEIWVNLLKTAESSDYIRDMRINELLTRLLTKLMEETCYYTNTADQSYKKDQLPLIKDYLDKHYYSKISLDQLSKQYYINKYYLTHSFKVRYGISISQYLMNLRITQAKNLLRFTKMPLEEIAEKSGLNTLYYFSRTFKKVEGISPSTYRKNWE